MTKSTNNYELWKQELRDRYLTKFPHKRQRVEEFISYVSKVYDPIGRAYLPKRLLWYLYNKKVWAMKNNTHIFIAVIGRRGGEGKSTLLHNVCHFLDSTYTPERVCMNYNELLRMTRSVVKGVKYPCVLFDEPDVRTHQFSKKGMHVKEILERIRQLNLIVGCCANSLTSIPNFIYERVTIVIHINEKHRFFLFDNAKDKPRYSIVDDIKNYWTIEKHALFKNPKTLRRCHFKNMNFSKEVPFDLSKYLKDKHTDLLNTIDEYLDTYDKTKSETTEPKKQDNSNLKILGMREQQVLNLTLQGLTPQQIATQCGTTPKNISMTKFRIKKKGYNLDVVNKNIE